MIKDITNDKVKGKEQKLAPQKVWFHRQWNLHIIKSWTFLIFYCFFLLKVSDYRMKRYFPVGRKNGWNNKIVPLFWWNSMYRLYRSSTSLDHMMWKWRSKLSKIETEIKDEKCNTRKDEKPKAFTGWASSCCVTCLDGR